MPNTDSFEDLSQWLAWLEQVHPIDKIELGLARIKKVAALLELERPRPAVITIAGTNGKGSVVATLEALSKSHQLKIGSYTSPHLIKFNERIKIDGIPVADELIVTAFKNIEKIRTASKIKLTYFEYTTLVALFIFKQFELDLITLEVGLGGRLDAVNVIDCDLAIVTSIGLDHTDWLGHDLTAIAHEKGGIMRSGKPLILAEEAIAELLRDDIKKLKPQVVLAGKDYQLNDNTGRWHYSSKRYDFKNLSDSNLYSKNLAVALMAFEMLFETTFVGRLSSQAVIKAMANITNMGRFQILQYSPKIILDVAHNPDSAKLLNHKLISINSAGSGKTWAICGMLKDKDIEQTIAQLTSVNHWMCLDLPSERGTNGQQIAELLVQNTGIKAQSFGKIEQAVAHFNKYHERGDQLIVFGSFLTVSAMLQYWENEEK